MFFYSRFIVTVYQFLSHFFFWIFLEEDSKIVGPYFAKSNKLLNINILKKMFC